MQSLIAVLARFPSKFLSFPCHYHPIQQLVLLDTSSQPGRQPKFATTTVTSIILATKFSPALHVPAAVQRRRQRARALPAAVRSAGAKLRLR